MFEDIKDGRELFVDKFEVFLKTAIDYFGLNVDVKKYSELFKPILTEAAKDCISSEELYDLAFSFAAAFAASGRNLSAQLVNKSLRESITKIYLRGIFESALEWRQGGQLTKAKNDGELEICEEDDESYRAQLRTAAEQDRIEQRQWEAQLQQKETQKAIYRSQLAQLEVQREQAMNQWVQNGRNILDYQSVRKLEIEIDKLKGKIR